MTVEFVTVVSLGCALVGGVIGIAGYRRKVASDSAQDGKKEGIILTEIGYVKAGIDDIKCKQDRMDEKYISVVQKLTEVDSSCRTAHSRIDTLENSLRDTPHPNTKKYN